MHDMNFFTIIKRGKSKNNGFKIFLILFLVIAVLLNALLILGGRMIFGRIEDEIAKKEAYINDEATKDKIKEAEILSEEVKLISEYLRLLQDASDNIEAMKHLDSKLLDEIRKLTPLQVTFQGMYIIDRKIRIECTAETELAAIDMYHAFMDSALFMNTQLALLTVNTETLQTTFTIEFAVAEEVE